MLNANIVLERETEGADDFRVIFRGKDIGVVWLTEVGTWTAADNRYAEETPGFDSKEDAANWLIGG